MHTSDRTHAILFDLDDTLFDHQACSHAALRALRDAFPALRTLPFVRLEREYHRMLEQLHPKVMSGELNLDTARAYRLVHIFSEAGTAISLDAARQHAFLWRDAYDKAYRPVRGAITLVRTLHSSVVIGIITNNRTAEQQGKLRRLRLEPQIDFLLTSEAAGRMKPDPKIFLQAVEMSRCRPEHVLVVGDSWASDILGARAAGLRAVWFNRAHAASPDPTVPEVHAWPPVPSAVTRLLQLVDGDLV